ncbi:hypothetical protein K440DRAFT_550851 [Wilcoxina mikolae CBS 423.85]|nr:hypothetical protein K440DRAFT_550851 [Wilcoxina mikolae CBS 423.85]
MENDPAAGHWGENDGEAVDVDSALNEYEEIRRELSRGSARRSSVSPTRRASIFSTKRPQPDEEEGGVSTDADFIDLEEYLQNTHRERNKVPGVFPKKIGVSFRDLSVLGFAGAGWMLLPTFPQELASIFGWDIVGFAQMMLAPKPPPKAIIQGFSGVVRPGEMLLVLAKPGSGASTFLRALTNQPRAYTKIEGDVGYARLPFELARGQYRGEILYNDEEDAHLPTLSVAQTLRFALKAKTPKTRIPGTSREQFVEEMLTLFAQMFKMKHVLNTIVGNAFVRGVSGGERKRVSIMEALASRSAINAWDNSTRGLDSSTAVDYIRSLRILTNITYSTTIVTLYQAGEQIYQEFDKVCLIYEGRQIFFGKASEARPYFEGLGFEATPRITTSDFLTTITEPTTQHIRAGMEGKVPVTPEALEAAFRRSKFYTEIQEELEEYDRERRENEESDTQNFKEAVKAEKSRNVAEGSPYVVNFWMQVWYLTQRELQLQVQDVVAMRSKFINVLVLGFITGSLFYNIQRTSEGAFFIGGVLFFNIIVVAWMQIIEAINMVMGRGIVAKQVAFAFYRPSALVLARTIADLPSLAIQSTLFSIILYWMAGLVADAGKFFTNLLFVFTTVLCLTGFYRAIGSFSKNINVAIRLAFLGLNVIALFAGYMQPYKTMKSWVYKWIYWANPLAYSLEAVMINQFHGMELACSPAHLVPGVPGASIKNQVCTLYGSVPQSATVAGTNYIKGFGYEPSHLWRNFGILLAFTVGYIIIAMIGIEYMDFGAGGGSIKILAKKPKDVVEELPTQEKKQEKKSADPEKALDIARRISTVKTSGSIFTWTNVNYSVGTGAGEAQLLHNINGYVKPGTLTALMGPSGAGKTTLLDNLGLRKRVGKTSGELLMDGKKLMPDFKRSTAFVEQQDIHDEMSTVREAMRFSALLRQPPNVSKEDKYKFVEEIIKLLELESLADSIIGFPGFGLSVEERKRVTIGVELASAPAELLFLDEPTSGLDANGALSIVRFLRKLADESGIAILCTIHQPSAVLIQEFDDLLLLSRGGKEVYFGPIGKEGGQTVINYFERNGAVPAAGDVNPAEYVLDTIRTSPGARSWAEIWDSSPESVAVMEEIDAIITTRKDQPVSRELRTLEYAMPLSVQIAAVTSRVWRHYWRDASYGFSKVFSNLSMGLIGGVLFLNSGETVLEMQSRTFAVFVVLILSPLILTGVQPKFLQFRMLYETRERNSKIYSAPAWITAMTVVEIPYAILGSIFFFLPWYYMIGLPKDSSRAGYAFFLVMLFNIWIPHIAMWIAAVCPDLTIISVVNPFIFVVTNGFTGILVTYYAMPYFYRSWVYWVNPLTWFSRGLIADFMHDVTVRCSPSELVSFQPPSGQTCRQYAGAWLSRASGYIVNLDATDSCQYCIFKSGDEYLKTINVQYSHRWRDLGIFCVFIVSNIVLIYVLYWAVREYRWSRLFARLRGKGSSK